MKQFLPPANVVCECYIFTPVCDSVNGGCLPEGGVWDTPPRQTPPPGRHPLGRHPQADTPPGRHLPLSRHPQADTPPGQTPLGQTPLADTPQADTPLGLSTPPRTKYTPQDTVNAWAVRILLECKLVSGCLC